MRRTNALVLASLLLGPLPAAAQVGSMRVTVPSPTAASLGKFGDVPVSFHTGVPDITIPLFTAKGRTLELPIVLKYHPTGIRVEEIGSWVGLGWSLEAGGAVTRTVRGLVDESGSGYYNTGHTFYNDLHWQNPPFEIVQNIKDQMLDGEPDRFFFSFAGRSGQFVMGPTSTSTSIKEYRLSPHQKVRIVPTFSGGQIASWQITTEEGTRYTFAAAEYTSDESTTQTLPSGGISPPTDGPHNTSWHLTEIRSVGGDVITLHYTSYIVRHRQGRYHERFDYIVASGGSCVPSELIVTNEHQIAVQRLDSITTAQHTVRFTTTLRTDALSPTGAQQEYRLDRVSIRTPSGTELRRFQLQHTYSPDGRLRLLSVAEQDASGASLPPYTLTYDSQALPDRTSYALDHWGYFNGKTGNVSPIPAMIGPNGTPMSGADRKPDSVYLKAGVLTRITYPTGGYNEFVYEPNDYGAVGASGALPLDAGPQQMATVGVIGNQSDTEPFTVGGTEAIVASVTVETLPSCPEGYVCGSRAGISGVATWYTSGTYTLTLTPNAYTLFAEAEDDQEGAAMITIKWQDVGPSPRKLGAGLRIAEVRTADAMGNVTTRLYRYRLQSDTARSSGAVSAEPRYHFAFNSSPCSYFSRSSQSKMPLGEGPFVGYREVMVLHGANGEYGRTLHTFRSVLDAGDWAIPSSDVWPFSPSTSMEWKRGQSKGITEYSASGQVQRRSGSSYQFREGPADSAKALRAMSINTFSVGSSTSYLYHAFEIFSAWSHTQNDTTFVYDEAGGGGFSTVTTYAHANPEHLQLTATTETNSDGTQRITRLRYPADYAEGSDNPEAAALTAMQGVAHIHNAVIERVVIEKNGSTEKIVQAELTTFKEFAPGKFLPYQRFVLNSPSPIP